MSRDKGLADEKIAALHDYENADCFDGTERLVLRYTDAMTATPVEVPDELFDALRAKFDEKQMVELTAMIAWENFRARFDHAFGAESEGFSDGAACVLPAAPSSV